MPRKSRPASTIEIAPDLFEASLSSAKRHFLGWDKPLVSAVVGHIAADWSGSGALDLSTWLIIVPTRNASRRLREALAVHAAGKNAAVLPPLVVTPDFLTSPAHAPELHPAGGLETRLIWAAELLRIDLGAHRELFPVDPVERGFSWALKTAGDLLDVRETLNEKGLSFADVARIFEGTEMEPERWRDLASIERHCVRATEQRGFADWQTTRRVAAAKGRPPAGIERVVMAGVLDPSALAVEALENWSHHLPVDVLVYAPEESHRDAFDAWGRPRPDAWLTRPVDIPTPETTIHQGGTPAEQADVAVELLASYDDPGAVAAIGVADTEISAPLKKSLSDRGISAFDPAGRPMGTHGVFHLLRIVSQLAGTRSFRSVAELVHCPDVADTIRGLVEGKIQQRPQLRQFLDDFDKLAVIALPDTLDDALELAPREFTDAEKPSAVPPGLAWIDRVLKSLSGDDFGSALTGFLGEVFDKRRFQMNRPQDAVFAAIADQISEVLDMLEGPAADKFPGGLDSAQKLELLLQTLGDEIFYPDRKANDIDLQGWLELLWEDAPHLVITGMNDGKAPEAILGHTFLPDSARRALGLRCNDTRFARDACLMTALIESRRHNGGRVDFIFGRTGADGTPLRPSRLLFQCADPELPARTLHFFKKETPFVDPVPWKLAWKLKPRPVPENASILQRLSVTKFDSYLQCPFRFYLRHGLGMNEIDTTRSEMDAAGFGSLLHGVLETFALDPEAVALTDADKIRDAFHAILDRRLHGIYGPRLTVPVTIQRESARQRLGWWAEKEAQQRQSGWQIIAAETYISPKETPWKLADMIVSGVVDRVERHEQLGIRLIDFKTHSAFDAQTKSRRTVEDYHLLPLKRGEEPELVAPWRLAQRSDGKTGRWVRLQLPLYRLAMEERYPGEKITTAHVTLSKTKPEIDLDEWAGLDGVLLESARTCAEGVITAIRGHQFWPPAEKLPYDDDFGHLFFGEVLEAVDASWLTGKEAA
ncbi:MAG: PD-(D/E)XK nuclease family protein [Prosthecobacter sp.]